MRATVVGNIEEIGQIASNVHLSALIYSFKTAAAAGSARPLHSEQGRPG
jgi:hypothetical protein